MVITLLGTPRSHFTRKVRLLLDHLHVAYQLEDVGDVSRSDHETLNRHPTMTVPIALIDKEVVYDSDEIARKLVTRLNPGDDFCVNSHSTEILNMRAVLNAAMAAEVRLIVASRLGHRLDNSAFFDKSKMVINRSLDWCEERFELLDATLPKYLDFHFKSFWDHLHFYRLVESRWPQLEEVSAQLDESPLFELSSLR
ncbi:MAG: glutathione S-transferase N-terminal domain-containing protein [Pseudomonadota bacterium]